MDHLAQDQPAYILEVVDPQDQVGTSLAAGASHVHPDPVGAYLPLPPLEAAYRVLGVGEQAQNSNGTRHLAVRRP